MTSQKQLKSRIRERMARTGERYAAARDHVVAGASGNGDGQAASHVAVTPIIDNGYALRGGTNPDAAGLANVLAHRGVVGPDGPLPEALIFGIQGGLGAGYILWEFHHDASRIVTLGFDHSWNYLDRRLDPAIDRLGIDADWSRTSGAKGAAASLRTELALGNPAIIWPDWFHIGYWHLPASFDGRGGHGVVAYAETEGRVHLDDRNLAPLTVGGADLDRARARIGSYQNAMLVVRTADATIDGERLRSAVRAGITATVEHLSSPSDSFSLPAWLKWSRLLVDTRNAKAWPKVFADGRELLGALLSVWDEIEPAGMAGGNLRDEFAEFLELAGDILGSQALAAEATRWREVAVQWHELAEAAAPADLAPIARARELTAAVTGAVAEGDVGAAERATAAADLWELRKAYAAEPPGGTERAPEIFAQMSECLAGIAAAETAAVAQLAGLVED